jgi:hypothetical protein
MWGSRQRIVDCPNCDGSGINPESPEVKMIKFWFSKEGNLEATSVLDNISKPELKSINNFSKNLSDYNEVGERFERYNVNFSNFKTGDIVLAKINSGSEVVCYFFKTGRSYFLLQDNFSGDTPESGSDWRKFATCSWNITNHDYRWIQKLELKKEKEEKETEIDPFSFNKPASFSHRGVSIDRYTRSSELERNVNKSDFALIFNLDKLKTTEFKTRDEIKDTRKELKSGSRLTIKDSDIKKANIERYMTEIAKRSDIISDVNNLQKVVKRFVGGENILFFMIYNSRFTNSLSTLGDDYILAMREFQASVITSNTEDERYKKQLSSFISDKYKSVSTSSLLISKNLKETKEYCLKEGFKQEYKIVEDLEKLSKKIYQIVCNMSFNCVEDIDILKAKLDSIRSILRGSRYGFDFFDYFIDSLVSRNSSENSIKYLTEHHYVRNNKSQIITGIESALKVLDRF